LLASNASTVRPFSSGKLYAERWCPAPANHYGVGPALHESVAWCGGNPPVLEVQGLH
jgi:hypothetical protein